MYEAPDPNVLMENAQRILNMYEKLNCLRLQNCPPGGGPAQQAMKELEAVLLDTSGMEQVKPLLLEEADGLLAGGGAVQRMDEKYGQGWSEFYVQAVMAYCK